MIAKFDQCLFYMTCVSRQRNAIPVYCSDTIGVLPSYIRPMKKDCFEQVVFRTVNETSSCSLFLPSISFFFLQYHLFLPSISTSSPFYLFLEYDNTLAHLVLQKSIGDSHLPQNNGQLICLPYFNNKYIYISKTIIQIHFLKTTFKQILL